MVITYSGNDSVAIKTKTETVLIGPGVTVGSFALPGAGEYDIASIQVDGVVLSSSIAYFIRTEELTTLVLDQVDPAINAADELSNTDILIVDVRSDDTPESVKSMVKAIEPSYLVLTGAGATVGLITALGLPRVEGDSLKVSRTSLPLEGTTVLARA